MKTDKKIFAAGKTNSDKGNEGESLALALWARKLVFLIIGLFVIGAAARGQVNGDYQTLATGNWNANTTWQVRSGGAWVNCAAGDYPGATAGAGTVTVLNNIILNINPANAIEGLKIQANLTPNNSDRTLNVSGDFSITAGTLSLSANNGRVTTFNIGGDFSMSGGAITETANVNGAINFNGTGVQSFIKTAGTISQTINFTVNGGSTIDMGTSVLDGSIGTFTLSSGAGIITKHAQGISTTAGTGCIQVTGAKAYNINADYTFNSTTGNQVTGNGLPPTVRNLTINNSATNGVVDLTSSTTVSGILTLNSGILSLGANNITLANGSTLAGNVPSATNMVATSGAGRFFKYFTTGDSPAFSFPVGEVTGTAEYSPITLDFSANTVAGTVGVNVTDAVHPSINTGGTATDYLSRYWTFSTTLLTNYTYNVSTYQYNASDINGVEGSMKLSFWNGTAWNTIANSNAGGNLLSISSSLDQATGTLNGNAFTGRFITYYSSGNTDPSNVNNWWSNTNGTGSHPANFTSNNQRFVVQNGHNMTTGVVWTISGTNTILQIQNGGVLTENNNITLSANTTLQIDNGGTLNQYVNSISIFGGTELIGNTSTINYGFAGAQSVIALNYGNLTLSNSGTKTLQGDIIVGNGLTISGTANLTFGTTPARIVTVNGTLSFASGTINMTGNAGVNHSLVLNGNTSCAPIGSFTKGTGTVTYGGAAAQSIMAFNYYNLTKSGAGNATLCGDINVENNLTISAGTITSGIFSTNLGGNFLNNGTFNAGTGTVQFNGSLLQTLGGSSNTTFNNLIINNTNGVDLGASITVSGLLTLTNGNLRLSNSNLTITNPIDGGVFSNTRMIITNGTGSLIKQGTTNADFQMVYPIGTGTAYTPVQVASLSSSSISGTGTFAIRSVATTASGIPGNNPLTRHWITSSTNINSAVADIRFTFVNGDVTAPATSSDYNIMYNPSSWTVPGGSGSTGSNPLTSSAATSLNATWSATVFDKYTIPTGITSIKVECWGAGGGGSSIAANGARGGGGGGGAYAKSIVSVIPGNTYYFIKGTGGPANSPGGSSSFGGTLVVAAGGSGGTFDNISAGAGGLIASSTGTVRYAGGNGANGGGTWSGGGGGGAGTTGAGGNATGATAGSGTSQNGGNGGTGVNNSANGQNGVNYGGGGSGASTNSATDMNGGTGANGHVLYSLPSQITLSSATQTASANVYQGTVKLPVFSFETAVVTSEANLTAITFNTTGTYIAADITRIQLWYNTSNNIATATQVGVDISTSLGAGVHTLSGFSRLTALGTTGYFWITADLANTATPNATLSVDAIIPSNLTYELATVGGSTTNGGIQTFLTVPRVDLSSANPAVPIVNVNQGTKNHPIYKFTTAVTWATAALNSVTFNTGGSYAATDVLNFKLWYNNSDDLSTALQIGSPIIGLLGSGAHTFSGLNHNTLSGTTGYFWITADIAPFPVNGRTINVSAITPANLTFSSPVFFSGTQYAGGNQTIITQTGVFITSTYPAVSANSVLQGALKQNVYKFSTIVSGAAETINSVSFNTTGTYAASDLVNFKLYYSTINSLVGATQIGSTLTTGLGVGSHTFSGLTQNTLANTIAYFWITADIAPGAISAQTITVTPVTTADLVYAGTPGKNGTTYPGGIQTIQLKVDTDGDGVADLYDLDDDNDGIPDYDENLSCNTSVAELFPNSNFDVGNTGFSTGYGYVTIVNQTSLHPEGIYAITPNANLGHGAFDDCSSGHGNMMVVNGSSNANLIVWSSGTIPVTPNTDYTLTINLTSVNPGNPAQLIFNVNGENIGLQFNATGTNCEWVPGIAIWNSGSNTSATFDIMNLNLAPGGNDFAIDDVSCKYKINCDYDGDGIPDKLDVDSDNDGIYDVVEAGGLATATGTITGFVDADIDGLSDNVDNRSSGSGGTDIFNGTPLANPDTDSDLYPDRTDLDSDNDLCLDTKESGLTDADLDGILGSSPIVVDSRGKVTSAAGYTGTLDTNGDGIKDYVQRLPYITTQPQNRTLCPATGTTFSVTATNTGGAYQWQVSSDNGSNWVNLTDVGVYTGTSGSGGTGIGTLNISNAVTTAYDTYLYRIILSNPAYNCSSLTSSSGLLRVFSGAPPAPGSISGNATICSSVSQLYSVTALPTATSYTWSLPVGWSITAGAGTNSITANTGMAGGTISVTASNLCGTSAASTLAVNISAPTPTITAPASGATVCQSADITYTTQASKSNYIWTIGGALGVDYIVTSGGSSTDNSVVLKWLTTGSKSVTVNYTSGGCAGLTPASVSVTVNANALILTQPVAPAPVCDGTGTLPLSITATGVTGYQWQVSTNGGSLWANLSNGGFYSNVTTAAMTITNPPASYNNYQYRCEVTGACGTATSFAVILTVNLNTVSAASATPALCINTALTNITHTTTGATGIGAASGLPAGVIATWSGNTITISGTPSVSGSYNYSIPLTGGCGAVNATGTITVNSLPTISIAISETSGVSNDGFICNGDAVILTASGGTSYSWAPATGLSAINVSNPTATPTTAASPITYIVTATDGNGCVKTASQVIVIIPKPSTGDLYRKPNN